MPVLFNQTPTQAVPAERKKAVKLCQWLLEGERVQQSFAQI